MKGIERKIEGLESTPPPDGPIKLWLKDGTIVLFKGDKIAFFVEAMRQIREGNGELDRAFKVGIESSTGAVRIPEFIALIQHVPDSAETPEATIQ
jgi:hypothetical protein